MLPNNFVRLTRRESVGDRKSTRLNSCHSQISYAVFCLKKKLYEITVDPGVITRQPKLRPHAFDEFLLFALPWADAIEQAQDADHQSLADRDRQRAGSS